MAEFIIRGKHYEIPGQEKMGELRVIEKVTGITHREYRKRLLEQQERFSAPDVDELSVMEQWTMLDEIVRAGRVALAVARANPGWSTNEVARFVDDLAWDEVDIQTDDEEEDDARPPDQTQTASETGSGSASPSNSDSATDSSESTPASSGVQTSPTSQEEQSASTT